MDTRLTATHDTRRLLLAIIVVLAVVMGLGATSASAAPPTVCRVQNTDTGTTYEALQAAVDAASKGDRLTVQGTCLGGTLIDEDLVIEGVRSPGSGKPTLSGAEGTRVVAIELAVSVQMRKLVIRDGEAMEGAGILNAGSLVLRDVEVRNNSTLTGGSGGGVSNTGTLTLSGASSVHYNYATSDSGGGVWNRGALTLDDTSSINDNDASDGAGVRNERGATVTLNDSSSISDNYSSDGPAGVSNSGAITLNDASSISDNSAYRRAGVLVDAGATLTLNDSSSVRDNYAGGSDYDDVDAGGGGVAVVGGTLTLNDSSSIRGNEAQSSGGGVRTDGGGTVILNGASSIGGNRAPDGGGLFMADGTLTLNDAASISGNEAWWDGGGVYHAGGTLTGAVCGSAAGANVFGNSPDDCYFEDTALSLRTEPTLAPEIAKGPAAGQFTPGGSLTEARWWHTATLLRDGRVLVVGGYGEADQTGAYVPDPPVDSAEVWDPETGTFTPTGSMAEARVVHTATLLRDGRVLVVGGGGAGEDAAPSTSAEVWDPATGEFTPAGSLATGRAGHTATLLPRGRVLVVGGDGSEKTLASAEVWDPATNEFTPAGTLAKARSLHTAALLRDGRVLVLGGVDWSGLSTVRKAAEVWDPETNEFARAGVMPEGRMFHTATLLSDGRVAVVGGYGESLPTDVLFWDPAKDRFAPAGSLAEGRANHTATRLPDGRVLVIGGGLVTMGAAMAGESYLLASAEVWDPVTEESSPAGSLDGTRGFHTATLLPDGRVLVVGGMGEAGTIAPAEIWEPVDESLPTEQPEATAVPEATGHPDPSEGPEPTQGPVPSHQPEPAGGSGDVAESGPIESRDPSLLSGHFAPAGSLAEARTDHTATRLPDGRVLVVGGSAWGPQRYLASAEIWDPTTTSFTPTGSLAEGRENHTAIPLPDGRALVFGGWGEDDFADSVEIWDPASEGFSAAGSLAEPRNGTATPLLDGRVLFVGGWGDRGVLASADIWDPATTSFAPAGSLAEPRGGHTATLLPDGRVLIVGGGVSDDEDFLASVEVWDPASGQFSSAGSLIEARWNHTATLLPDGRVLVLGGEAHPTDYVPSAEIWDPATATFSRAGLLLEARIYHTATLLPDGRVLVVGGYADGDAFTLASAEVWDPAWEQFSPASSLSEARRYHTATLLLDGRVLVVGGWGDDDVPVVGLAEVWAPSDRSPPTGEPEASPAPEATAMPEATDKAEPSEGPEPTQGPVPSHQPEPTGGKSDLPAVSLPEVPAPAQELRVGRSLGDPEAPVKIDVFEDPQCPPCGTYTKRIEPRLIAGPVTDGQVLLTYKDFPFLGPESLDAAVAMRVAEAMDGKFWEYHAVVFHNQQGENEGAFSLDRLADMAELVGLDREAFLAEMADPAYLEAVQAEAAEGFALDISSVPTLTVDGEIVIGVPAWKELSARIEAALPDPGPSAPPEATDEATTGPTASPAAAVVG